MAATHIGSRIIQSFNHFLHYYQSSQLSCGMILARADMNEAGVREMEAYLEKEEPGTAFQVSYDPQEKILGILLDGCALAYTHFLSLHVKDVLSRNRQLTGDLWVGSFPENSDHAEQMMFDMLWKIIDGNHQTNDIHVYQGQKEKDQSTKSVLLVDSDQSLVQLLTNYLQGKGYVVHTAEDGKTGVDVYQNVLPDLVITEINLSALGGYQFINQIKNIDEDSKKSTEIIVLTNKQLEEDVRRTFDYGVSDYMTKPFSLVELEARMKRLVSVSK
ncbi:response regulator transcription factor [Halobacillus kuroshimensis]|uniref:Response regulator transcription factor n=1 Tax=Halobacillus kuroshimensis TaxID=302481 RepID=A0ABS3DX81_9BACI|nr:response regulator [Halobacillus kuroshimensis]MBN8235923.1 response regulator transcription factor [Halobacillus kuroshimensis]